MIHREDATGEVIDTQQVTPAVADRSARNAALALSLALPGDVLLYLLLPIYAATWGLSLAEAGILLAANRLIRIVGYGWVSRSYSAYGARAACLVACAGAILSTLSYAVVSGFWMMLAARLVWGLSFATLNIANQALPASSREGIARRAGRARAIVAIGPMCALMVGAVVAQTHGPRLVFAMLAAAAAIAPVFALKLPIHPEVHEGKGPLFAVPEPISIWSFAMGFALDGIFVFGLSLVAAHNVPQAAVLAAGSAMALRYASEIALAPLGGSLAQRFGARPLLIVLSLVGAVALALIGSSGILLWVAVLGTVVLRAMLQPLPVPVIAEAFPGPQRIPALARQATWRDIGAGTGPLAAGLLFPILSGATVFAGAGALLATSSLLLLHASRVKAVKPDGRD